MNETGVKVLRHGYEGAEETVQGLAGLLLEEGEAVSYGRLRFVGGENFFRVAIRTS